MQPTLDSPIVRIMTRDPITIGPGARVSQARALLLRHRMHHVPVVRDGVLVGIVSSSDLRRYGPLGMFAPAEEIDARLDCYMIAEVMTPEPVTVSPVDTIRHAVELLRLDSFSALPVVDDAELVGIVTVADVFSFMITLIEPTLQLAARATDSAARS